MKNARGAMALLLLAVLAAYANHFQNGFHFDDYHTITENAFLTRLVNIPRFFTDAALSSTRPATATYRPVTTTSLAVDYWLGNGFEPFFFHASTFFWFAVQLVLMFLLFRRILDAADPDSGPANAWTALAATACYGLHPANAETVNYIIQRADLYSTLGVVASLLWFVARPEQRKRGWYLIPALLACLSKAPALIFPFILTVYVWLFEADREKPREKPYRQLLPAYAAAAAMALLTSAMTPATFEGGAASAASYRLTQPWVALHYFKSFFLPTELSADTDWGYVSSFFSGQSLAGWLFVAGLAAAAFRLARGSLRVRPIAFGILWFFLALAPTSLLPLAEVTNDHRMFFPFVGLSLAVFSALRLALAGRSQAVRNSLWLRAVLAGFALLLAAEAAGTRARNHVWRSEDSLWEDVAHKSPNNARGLMNYGITFAHRGDNATALSYMERARALMPDYSFLEMNLGITNGNLGRDAEAEQHYRRAIQLAPDLAEVYLAYATWLRSHGRTAEARAQLEAAVHTNRLSFPARNLLMEIYADEGNTQALDALIEETLRLTNNDDLARRYLAERANRKPTPAASAPDAPAPEAPTPEAKLHESAGLCRAAKFDECIAAARQAIALKPDYAEAYNNIAAASIVLQRWDDAIEAATRAVGIQPDFELAKKNLQRALLGKQSGKQAH